MGLPTPVSVTANIRLADAIIEDTPKNSKGLNSARS